jgi:hypothetical protein
MKTSLTLQDEISGFRGGATGDKSLRRLDAVLLGEQVPRFLHFETSGTTRRKTRCHIPDDFNLMLLRNS